MARKTTGEPHTTITVPEIAQRLGVSEETVYGMLKAGDIPNIRRRHLFIVSRSAYEHWEGTIGGGTAAPRAEPLRIIGDTYVIHPDGQIGDKET